jgi:hypothetical protein
MAVALAEAAVPGLLSEFVEARSAS